MYLFITDVLLGTTSSGFICVIAYVRIFFLERLNNTPLYVYTILCLSIHLLMDSWVSSAFWLVNHAPVNMDMQIFLQDLPCFQFFWECFGPWFRAMHRAMYSLSKHLNDMGRKEKWRSGQSLPKSGRWYSVSVSEYCLWVSSSRVS